MDSNTLDALLDAAEGGMRLRGYHAVSFRELADEHDIPIVENPPQARALYAGVEIDEEIPQEHFKAVAEIIGYVMRLKGKMPHAR